MSPAPSSHPAPAPAPIPSLTELLSRPRPIPQKKQFGGIFSDNNYNQTGPLPFVPTTPALSLIPWEGNHRGNLSVRNNEPPSMTSRPRRPRIPLEQRRERYEGLFRFVALPPLTAMEHIEMWLVENDIHQ